MHRILNGQRDGNLCRQKQDKTGRHARHVGPWPPPGAVAKSHLPARQYQVVLPQASACIHTDSRHTTHSSCQQCVQNNGVGAGVSGDGKQTNESTEGYYFGSTQYVGPNNLPKGSSLMMMDRKLWELQNYLNLSKQSRAERLREARTIMRASLANFGLSQTKILKNGENC